MQETWMSRNKREIILERTRRELLNEDSVALGKGLPQGLRKNLSAVGVVPTLLQGGGMPASVGAIVVEADEVSPVATS